MGTSGQNVDDIYRFSEKEDRLEILEMVKGLRHHFDIILAHFSRLAQPRPSSRAVWCTLFLARYAYWMLIGACDPMNASLTWALS